MSGLNIRPYTDALRSTGAAWRKAYDNRMDGTRTVALECLYRGTDRVGGPDAWAGDRLLKVALWSDGDHSVSHMLVTRDGPLSDKGEPQFLRGITKPTSFSTPAEMLIAIQVELLRGDHPPMHSFGMEPLDQRTSMLVDRFALAMKSKLMASQHKSGWRDEWAKNDWPNQCARALCEHVAKGDPLDVAAYAAFMWHHGWPTVAFIDTELAATLWRDLTERALLQLASLDAFMKAKHGTSSTNRTQLIADLEQRLGVKASAIVTGLGGGQ